MPDLLTRVDEAQAAKTSKEDLCRTALEHYEKVSGAAHEWYSSIPRAIKQYYESDPEHQRLQSAVVEAVTKWRKEGVAAQEEYCYKILPMLDAVDALIAFEAEHGIGSKQHD